MADTMSYSRIHTEDSPGGERVGDTSPLLPHSRLSTAYPRIGLSGLWSSPFAFFCAIFASLGGLTFGYDQGVIANILVMKDFVTRWPIGAWEKGLMTAMLELGALIGALFAGTWADKYSRHHSILIACIIFCIGSIIQCAAQSITQLTIGRGIGGIGVGALSMLSPLYIAETAAPELRGSLLSLEQFSIVLGVVVGFWTGFATRNIPSSMSWRIPLAVQIVPGVILGIGSLFLPPSPRLLVLRGEYERAKQVMAKLRNLDHADERLEIELLEMRVEAALIEHTSSSFGHRPSTKVSFIHSLISECRVWALLFTPRYRKRTWTGIAIGFFQQWSAINSLIYFSVLLVERIGPSNSETTTLLLSGGIGIMQLLAVIPAIMIIDRAGRRPLLRVGSIIMSCSHLVIAMLVHQYESDWASHGAAGWIAIACMYTFIFAYGISFGPVTWVLPSEIFPLSVRSHGVALSTSSVWINNFLIGLLTPVMIQFSTSGTFGLFAVVCFIAYFWATYYVPETAGLSLEETDALFGDEGSDQELKRQIEDELGLTTLLHHGPSAED